MGRPFAYFRKSVIRRDQRTVSPETQEREVRALAARHGDNGSSLTMLADWDVSGRREKTSKRPEYLKLVAAIGSGECSAVYSYSLSRLARSVSELSRLFDACKDRGVPIRLVADNLDTSTASGLMQANILSAMAQFESDVASERVAAMYATKRDNGEDIRTRKRYGEHDGDDLDAVLRAYDEAGTYSGAARILNERGVKPSSGAPRRLVRADGSEHEQAVWWSSSVAVVVQRARPELTVRPSRQGQRGGVGFILAKLLKCGTCGSLLTGSRLPNRNGTRYVRYACRFAESAPHERSTVTEKQLMPWIEAEAARLRVPYDTVDVEDVGAERDRLAAQRKAVGDALVDGLYTRAQARERAASIDARIEALERSTTRVGIPDAVDWSQPPTIVNELLRSMWSEVELGPDLRPVRADWRREEWRAE